MSRIIFLTGCASTGTTLMKRLFFAFQDVHVEQGVGGEIFLEDLVKVKSGKPVIVGKRRARTIFSRDDVPDKILENQVRLIEKHKVRVLNMIRDGRDVILSRANNKPITYRRWIHAMRHRRRWGHLIAMEVRYEDLVGQPQKTQMEVAKRFGLKAKDRWIDYPGFVPPEEFSLPRGPKGSVRGARMIDKDSIGKNLGRYRQMIGDKVKIRHFEEELRRAGYL